MPTTFSGAHIDFSAAIWSNRPNLQVLSAALPLFPHRTDTAMHAMNARHFGALKKALASLKQCYDEEMADEGPRAQPNYTDYPYPLSYTCIETLSIHHFSYLSQIDVSKLLFTAVTTNEETICIKFVRHYSKAVHQFCASEGFAPTLKGFDELPGGWHMVVMEMIGDDYCCLSDFPSYRHFEDIFQKLASLHQAGYVHGDVRDTNIMVKKDGSPGFKLVDFDWAGIIGEVKYPMNVYVGARLWRPLEAEDGNLIMAEHDIAMLEAIFNIVE